MAEYIDVDVYPTVQQVDVAVFTGGPPGPPGVNTWGSLIGTLSDQGDLQAVLDLKSDIDGNGVVSGVQISINADPTMVDISAGVIRTVEEGEIACAGVTGVVLTYLTTASTTYIALDGDGNVIQKATPYTPAERRDYVLVGVAIHSNRTIVNAINNQPDVAEASLSQLNDLIEGLQGFNVSGNIFSPNGANLHLNKSAGKIFKKGANFGIDSDNPHIKDLPSLVAPANLRYRLSDGTEYVDTQVVSMYYESAPGVRTALPGNRYSVQRITLFPSNLVRIQYGQAIYNSLALAIQGVITETFVTEANMAENGLLRCFLIVKGSATSLQNTDDVAFIYPDRFGQIPIGSGGGTTNLQQAYDNSETPEITTDAIRGALNVRRGSAADTDDVLVVENGAGEGTVVMKGNGILQAGAITEGNYLDVEADGTLHFNGDAQTWIDIDFPIIIRTTGVEQPVQVVMLGTLTEPQWEVGDFAQCETQELIHSWVEGSTGSWHIHGVTAGTDITDRYVKFRIEFTWANVGGVYVIPIILDSPELLIPANTPAYSHMMWTVGAFTQPSAHIGAHVLAKLTRIASVGTAPSTNPFLGMLQIHVLQDTLGSRLISTK